MDWLFISRSAYAADPSSIITEPLTGIDLIEYPGITVNKTWYDIHLSPCRKLHRKFSRIYLILYNNDPPPNTLLHNYLQELDCSLLSSYFQQSAVDCDSLLCDFSSWIFILCILTGMRTLVYPKVHTNTAICKGDASLKMPWPTFGTNSR